MRRHLLLLALLASALAGVALLAVPGSPFHRDLRKGLDLQGGLEVVLEAKTKDGHRPTAGDLDRSVAVMRERIDKLGVSEPELRRQGANQIVIQLPAVHDPDEAAAIIGKTAQLELYDLESSLAGPSVDAVGNPVASASLHDLLARVQSGRRGGPSAYWLFEPRSKRLLAGPAASKPARRGEVLTTPAGLTVVSCSADTSSWCPGAAGPAPETAVYYLFEQPPQLTGEMLKLDGTRADFDPMGAPVVTLQFTGEGNRRFRDITRDEAFRGRTLGAEQHFAIVLDGELRSAPSIDYRRYPDGIDPSGGGAEINGLRSAGEARDLAVVLQTGALPVEFETVERTDVSATLGADSLRQARNAAIAGLVLVAVFLLAVYRFLGLVAVLGLAVYAALMTGAILLLGVTLTLPGFAGLILTIGVAADANVVVFERIKEESRAGRSVRAAIAAGYAKGLRTILDANAVTCITALVLFAVATASVKGFALMLLVGTVVSLLTAVAATRAMLGLLAGFAWFGNPRFMGATPREIPRRLRWDVVGRRRLWFVLSLGAIAASVVALAVQGLNLGIDFKGGVQVTATTPAPVPLAAVRAEAPRGAVVQGTGASTGERYRGFQIRMRELSPTGQTALRRSLARDLGADVRAVKNVSSSFSRQILRGAILAIAVSFALIALYVTLRYQWRFAVPILRTLVNDVLITLGVYAISGREVSASTVAAVLTILGYSIYDTIIVFDRVRENLRRMPRASVARVCNVSVWEVLRRSVFTTVITLLPIAALYAYGGATLQDFAFAIIVGITVGAVGTIFVATPLLATLLERDPAHAGRDDDEPVPRHGVRASRRDGRRRGVAPGGAVHD
jgi:SecD/SecF fusion protein